MRAAAAQAGPSNLASDAKIETEKATKMKTIAALAATFALAGTAHALPNEALIKKILGTRVAGEIEVAPGSGAPAGFGCGDVTVVAMSKDLAPHGPNEFGPPKWVRSANATLGRDGRCRYSMPVPPGHAFYLGANGHGHFECTSIGVSLNVPNVPISVPLGTVKPLNLAATKVVCEVLH
jgi:hypothetical protein